MSIPTYDPPTELDLPGSSAPAARPPGLLHETGDFLLAHSGDRLAFGFQGESDFIERGMNFAFNHSLISLAKGQKPHFLPEKQIGYVLLRDLEQLRAALSAQFRSEVIAGHEVPMLKCGFSEENGWELEYDETGIEKAAAARVEAFMTERVIREPFLMKAREVAPVYEVVHEDRSGDSAMERDF